MAVRQFIASLKSTSDAIFSRNYEKEVERNDGETIEQYEDRTWFHKCHFTPEGAVLIPPTMFKKALDYTAELKSLPIPSKGKKTYTALIKSGIIIPHGISLPITATDLAKQWLFVYSNPSRRGNRIWKPFPRIKEWAGDLSVNVTSDDLPDTVVEEHIRDAGVLRGIGSFAPRSGGWHGAFTVIDWVKV